MGMGVTLSCVVLLATAASAGGLFTEFGAFEVKNLRLGGTKLIRLDDGRRFSISNASSCAVTVAFQVEIPSLSPRSTWEPLPSTNWLTFVPASLTLAPHAVGETDLALHAPTNAIYGGRRFEAWIRSSTTDGPIGMTVISRLRFNLVMPDSVHVTEAPTGPPGEP